MVSSGSPVSSPNKTHRHHIAEILLKVALYLILIFGVLTSLSAIFHLYHDDQF
jgi:hypothetical protein